ncbi:MAG TPA: NAD(P)-binding protein, partial [Actinopolymorphaceae bacterium]|nr:NAD(P)-binding protein [Actinopolymorphaceae bacterium]
MSTELGSREDAAHGAGRVDPSTVVGHFVVCGSDSTAVRVTEELRAVNETVTVVVPDADADPAREMAELGATVVVASRPHETALRQAGVPTARAIALIAPDDLGNVHAALTAEELNPAIRLVVHIGSPRLGEFVERLVRHCSVVSAATTVAPEFVSAALEESAVKWIVVGGRDVVVGPVELLADPPLTYLAHTRPDGRTELLPDDGGNLAMAAGIRHKPRRVHPRLDDFLTDLRRVFDMRLRLVALVIVTFIALGTLILHVWPHTHGREGLDWLNALYIAVSTVTLTGF